MTQSTIDSEVDEIVAEVATKGMIAMQLAIGDGSPAHHEKVLKEAKQLITNLIAQEANKAYRKGYQAGHEKGVKTQTRQKHRVVTHNICPICKEKQQALTADKE